MIVELVLLFLVIVIVHHFYSNPKGMPPGPQTYPLVGSGMPMNLQQVKDYQKKYGDIFRCEMASVRMIYLCNFKLIKEGLSKMETADRPSFEGFHFMTDGKEAGVIFSNGMRWQNARRFLLRNLRDLGMGKSSLDEAIIQEAKYLVEEFKNCTGKPTKIPDCVNIAVLNVIWQMVASCRYDLHDREVTELIKYIKIIQDGTEGFFLLELFPLMKKILPQFVKDKFFNSENLRKMVVSAKKLFGAAVDSRKAELDPTQAQNVIDEYLIQMDQHTDISKFFNESDLMKIIFDLFGAGFDTTSNMLRWMCLYAAKYPEIQHRVQKQIDEVLTREDIPSHHHKPQLPLVEAFIHEVLRLSSLIPLGVMRATNIDTYLAGYYIPKGTLVFGVSGICHKDQRYWDKPEEFRLERFLDDEGRFVSHKEGFAPFGIGKRSCLGEALARMELSIFTASLLQNFTFSPPEGQQVDLTPDKVPLQNFAKKQEILITIRK